MLLGCKAGRGNAGYRWLGSVEGIPETPAPRGGHTSLKSPKVRGTCEEEEAGLGDSGFLPLTSSAGRGALLFRVSAGQRTFL